MYKLQSTSLIFEEKLSRVTKISLNNAINALNRKVVIKIVSNIIFVAYSLCKRWVGSRKKYYSITHCSYSVERGLLPLNRGREMRIRRWEIITCIAKQLEMLSKWNFRDIPTTPRLCKLIYIDKILYF